MWRVTEYFPEISALVNHLLTKKMEYVRCVLMLFLTATLVRIHTYAQVAIVGSLLPKI